MRENITDDLVKIVNTFHITSGQVRAFAIVFDLNQSEGKIQRAIFALSLN